MIQPIFIIGLPRSGSTLWSNIIARDSKVLRFGEMHYLNPWHYDFRTFLRDRAIDLKIDDNVRSLVDKLFSNETWRGLRGNYWEQLREVEPDTVKERILQGILVSDRSLGDLFRILVTESSRIRGYEKCLIKFPVYVNYYKELREWYPDAKIIHITRDPRATALSKTNDPGGTEKRLRRYPWARYPLRLAMKFFVVIQYVWSSRVHSKYKEDKNYALFRYEDLLVEPESEIRRLCEFTGLTYSDSMLNPRGGQPSSLTGERRSGIDPASGIRWKDKMSSFEAALIALLTKGSMRRLGYDPVRHPIFK